MIVEAAVAQRWRRWRARTRGALPAATGERCSDSNQDHFGGTSTDVDLVTILAAKRVAR